MFHDLYPYLNTNPSSVERKIEIFQQNITSCTLFDTFKVNYPVSGSKSVQYQKYQKYSIIFCVKYRAMVGWDKKNCFNVFALTFACLFPFTCKSTEI